ncbi:Hypothetical predicted protein [Olea europaea subsp. europaea]|uniref:Uncharacterized protein n=1 Tax=Olea europaea subsp. europaea TaxID=158383 RepID=A0A8S0SLB2_OLEEU|nr:Hypothetical predicted protein [Olea europaea subsp. europaea]
MDTVASYDTGRMTQEAVIPVESSRPNTLMGQASVFNKLGPTRDRECRPPIHPLKRAPSYFLEQTTSVQFLFGGKSE